MILSEEVLAEIAARASTFDERLQNGFLIAHPERDEAEIDRRLERWRDRATKGNSRLFEEALAMRDLDLESVRRGLGRVKLADLQRMPKWAGLLAECLATAQPHGESQPYAARFCNEAEPLPFEQILSLFVKTAVRRLRERAGTAYARLEDKAQIALERLLLTWLAGPCGSSLMLEFSLFRFRSRADLGGVEQSTEDSAELYHEFVRRMLDGEVVSFLSEYSVLARAITTVIEHWVSAMAEFLVRLDTDWQQLREIFDRSNQSETVSDIRPGLSDPHHGGRTVVAVKFSSGRKVIYKPKSLDTELAFGQLLDWVNRNGADLPLQSPKVLARAGYGWVEYLEHAPCLSEIQLTRFYHRSGMLLALFYVLDATDVHAENLMAVGEFPMLVDAETLITPQLGSGDFGAHQGVSEMRAAQHLGDSVLKTGMLPTWRQDTRGIYWDLSALGGVGGEEIEAPVWVGTHTDNMERKFSQVRLARNQNVPFQPNQAAEPGRFLEEIVIGFENVCRILMENQDVLLAENSPLEALARAPMRLVFRETQTYFNILKKSFDPAVLRDGADRSVDLEVLSRILFISESRTKHLPLVKVEKHALENLDIPAFTTFPATCSLHAGPERIAEDFFRQCGYMRVTANIRNLSAERCAEQCAIIRGSFYAKLLNQRITLRSTKNANEADKLVTAATEIGDYLQSKAIRGDDGGASWIGLAYRAELREFRYLPLGADLPDGQPGVALFLAALAKKADKARFHELAAAAMLPMRRCVRFALDETGWKKVNDGKMESASLIYSLVRTGELLGDSSLIELARDAANLVTTDLLERTKYPGLPDGTIAILFGLLALNKYTNDDSILERAALCGDHLLQQIEQPAAGRDHALNRLYDITNLPRFKRAVGLPRPATSSPGLLDFGLALLSSEESGDFACEWLKTSLSQLCESELMPHDSVAEGNFGFLELAVEAGSRFSRPDLLDAGICLAGQAVARAKNIGGYQICGGIPVSAPCFGYLHGMAGIGYTLLRAADPELRSILRWN